VSALTKAIRKGDSDALFGISSARHPQRDH
jgi:hypothetical protein